MAVSFLSAQLALPLLLSPRSGGCSQGRGTLKSRCVPGTVLVALADRDPLLSPRQMVVVCVWGSCRPILPLTATTPSTRSPEETTSPISSRGFPASRRGGAQERAEPALPLSCSVIGPRPLEAAYECAPGERRS
ncbi:unnamed protein product [Rangifer tarandus platyrhynchus]|uniref:Uncharacterized protein n=1 Tax=Rangifer tarandus platyrhynchus TaxID=3082113 RepID=A0AC59Z6Y7_RANTA